MEGCAAHKWAAKDFLQDNFFKTHDSGRWTIYRRYSIVGGFLPGGFQLAGKGGQQQKIAATCFGANTNASNLASQGRLVCGLYPNILVAPKRVVDG
jgi:hypothetical protein